MGRGVWRATVHRVTKSWTLLTTHTHTHTHALGVYSQKSSYAFGVQAGQISRVWEGNFLVPGKFLVAPVPPFPW